MEPGDLKKGDDLEAVFFNCRLPQEPGDEPERGWIIVSDGIIEDIGRGDLPGHRIFHGCDRIELDDHLLLPGFHDAHMHLYQWSISRKAADLNGCRSVKEVMNRLRSRIENHEHDPFLEGGGILFGVDYDESVFGTAGKLDGSLLQKEFPDIPVIVRRICGHRVVMNERAFDLLGIEDPGKGILVEEDAMRVSWELPLAASSMKEILRDGVEEIRAMGIIGGVDIVPGSALDETMRTYSLLDDPPTVSLSVKRDDGTERKGPLRDMTDWNEMKIDPSVYERDEPPVIFSKHFADGSIGARTASFTHPYLDGEKIPPLMDNESIDRFMDDSLENGLIPMIHAIGNRAVGSILEVRDTRPLRIEHAISVSPGDYSKIRDPKIAICMQPNFQRRWGDENGLYDTALGEKRLLLNDFRGLCRFNDNLCFGSDMMPPGPMYGIKGAVGHQNQKATITAGRYIDLYSRASARISFPNSGIDGCLRKGSAANLAIFPRGHERASMTAVRGRIVHSAF